MRHPIVPTLPHEVEPRPHDKSREAAVRRVMRGRQVALPRYTSGGLWTPAQAVSMAPAAGVYVVPGSSNTTLAAHSDPVFTQNSASNNELLYSGWPQLVRVTLVGTMSRSTTVLPGTVVHLVAIGQKSGGVPADGDQLASSAMRVDTYLMNVAVPFAVSCLTELREGDVLAPLFQNFLTGDTITMVNLQLYAETVKELTS